MPQLLSFPDRHSLCLAAAERFVAFAANAVRATGRCTIALSGGSTPNDLFDLLASKPFRSRIAWRNVHVFWGDERCVAPDDARSNYRAAYDRLLSHVAIPPQQIHRMRGEIDPGDAATEYEALLRAHFGTPIGAPRFTDGERFDLVWLGVGPDGHTASLFPGQRAVDESTRWVVAEYVVAQAMWRMTLTLPVFNAAAAIDLLIAGAEKRPIVERIMSSDRDAAPFPVQRVKPADGTLTWLLDAEADPFAPSRDE